MNTSTPVSADSFPRQAVAEVEAVYRQQPQEEMALSQDDISIVRELFGREFLTAGYFLQDLMIIED